MTFLRLFGVVVLLAAISAAEANSPPEPQGFGFMLPNESAMVGESVSCGPKMCTKH